MDNMFFYENLLRFRDIDSVYSRYMSIQVYIVLGTIVLIHLLVYKFRFFFIAKYPFICFVELFANNFF